MHTHNCSYEHARDILKDEVEALIKHEEKDKHRELNEIEKCRMHEKLAIKYFKSMPLITLKNWAIDMLRTSLSLYSAEILYIESGRQAKDYFNKDRSTLSMFKKYLWPSKDKPWLNCLVWLEILLYIFILIGLLFGAFKIVTRAIKNWNTETKILLCPWLISVPFICLFIFIALSGGYARMRLPVEPFLIILSLSFWTNLLKKRS
jgi:hypothetical protein